MSLSKLSSLDHLKVSRRLQKAQATCSFSISTEFFSEDLVKLVNVHSNAIGVLPEFIVWPLLTTTASLMSTNAAIKINQEWSEPSIIWFVIAVRKGEKKTAALKRVRKPIEAVQRKLHDDWVKDNDDDKPAHAPQLIVGHFSFEELHSMCRNRGQILGLFDEMSSFYGQLDLYKHSSTVDGKTLLTLNCGGSWSRNFKSYSATMEKTTSNVTGLIQPAFVYDMLNHVPDADGLNDCQLFDFPPEREILLDELVVPMPADTPDLLQTFLALYENHKDNVTYTLEGDAYTEYAQTHDLLVHDKLQSNNEDVQGILSKARGYCARIAMVIHSLEQTLQSIYHDESDFEDWDSKVSVKAAKSASAIIHHLNKQKFIMLGVDETDPDANSSQTGALSNRMCRLLSITWKADDGTITPSEVTQKHLCERVGQSYPYSKAMGTLREAESMGYGTVEDTTAHNKRKVIMFRKRPFKDLSDDCQKQLKQAKISEETYSKLLQGAHVADTSQNTSSDDPLNSQE